MTEAMTAFANMSRVKHVVSKIGSGKTPSGGSETYLEEGVIFLRSQNIHFGGLKLEDVAYISDVTHQEMDNTRLIANDILLNITGASLGRATRFPAGTGEANVNQHVCILRPKGSIDPRFLEYAISAHTTWMQISSLQVGGNRDGLNFEQVGNLRIPTPALNEQRRIADFLDAETTRIDRLRALQTEAQKRIDERDTALRDTLIDTLFNNVGEIPFRRLLTTIEQGTSPQCEAVPCEPGEWGVLKLSAVKMGAFNPRENKRLPNDIEPIRANEVRPGDFLVTRANTPNLVGDVAVVNRACEKLLLPDLIYRVGLSTSVIPEFVAQVAMSSRVRTFIQSVARGSSQSMVKLRGEDIRTWPIPAATIAQQEALVVRIQEGTSATASLRTTMNRQSALLAERRQALITAAVTGQFDVSSASGRGVE
ncbi:restriction endonuclease subunit S [Nonomuraea sp. NPDC005501]|uniref:restriction endonuclease subunit S n=1 Tax=Nonomuraea sp. NPDC005501 TaxID=3156884 RepID=UPI0033A93330